MLNKLCAAENHAHHAAAVGSGPFSIQSRGHLQATILLPVGPAVSTQPALHVGRPPRVPLIRAGGYTHKWKEKG